VSLFTFKQFRLSQKSVAQKMTTDSTLLGAWACAKGLKGLDVGTGSGILALMMAQRNPEIFVKAIEIDADSCLTAQANFAQSPWSSRLLAFEGNFLDFEFGEKFDCIWSNPPFFSQSLKPKDNRKARARHSEALPLELFFERVAELLQPQGCCALVLPTELESKAVSLAEKQSLSLHRKALIFTNSNQAKRVLLEFDRFNNVSQTQEIVIGNAQTHQYSQAYSELLKDFLTVIP
jgi:tRNA1Val (adenine37-N6)-methyltransferase